jgi:ferrous iron transport protein B
MTAAAIEPPSTGGESPAPVCLRIALLGNPNTGKTTLFNRLTGLRHKTSNFPGTTQEARVGTVVLGPGTAPAEIIDMPGVYSLELDLPESEVCRRALAGEVALPGSEASAAPDAVCIVLDSTNLSRNLTLVGEALRRRLPTVCALNMTDLADRRGLFVDAAAMSGELGCPVVCCNARSGEGVDALRTALAHAAIPTNTPPGDEAGLTRWADDLALRVVGSRESSAGGSVATAAARRRRADERTDRLDRVLIHPVLGTLCFVAIMGVLFWTIFAAAEWPMGLIDKVFSKAGDWTRAALPTGILADFLVGGVIGGVSGTLIFLPQICLLFFLISILEDTGYLARAALLMDRVLRPFGLPGHAFVPLLSSHACALPGIMSARGVPDPKERLATILVAPFMTCSARLPVYVLVTTLLFRDRPMLAALAFIGCYALGILAGVFSALIARRTILRGESRSMAIELPTFKRPSIRTALVTTYDRGWMFLKKAGTNILAICVVLWWLSSFPHVPPPPEAEALRAQAAALQTSAAPSSVPSATADSPISATRQNGPTLTPRPEVPNETSLGRASPRAQPQETTTHSQSPEGATHLVTTPAPTEAETLLARADHLEASNAKSQSYAGQLGRFLQPLFAPLGYDWRLTIGVVTSFAAREVFASTMSVVIAGEEDVKAKGVMDQMAAATRDDGVTPVFTMATCWSLLVYYVLAMQCLPTLAVTAREAGHFKWALLQLAWMSAVAYAAAFIAFRIALWWGSGGGA